MARVRADGREVAWSAPVLVEAGQLIDIGIARRGLRSYVAVSGGVAVESIFGSRSTDLLAGLGPPIVRDGAVLPLGDPVSRPAPTDQPTPIDPAPHASPEDEITLDCYLGPRDDWLTEQAITMLRSAAWTVSMNSNRVALRLSGPVLEQRDTAELSSEGIVLGAIEVPPDGQPIIFLADHPTTGGYPVAGVVPAPDIWLCGQARPGTRVRFRVRQGWSATAPTVRPDWICRR
jgi:biotin-dependent carboxylase-like uncharacterized protein